MKQFLLSALLLSFVSCSDELTELDGKWQLLSVESDGNVEVVDTVFIIFSHLFSNIRFISRQLMII